MKKTSCLIFLVITLGVIGCLYLSCGKAADADKTLLDMTYVYDAGTIYWPTAKHFELNKLSWGINQEGWWYASNEYSASEHGGTHADAPIHFAKGGRTMDQIPLSEWIGPAAKIDVTEECALDRDYRLTVRTFSVGRKSMVPFLRMPGLSCIPE